MKYASWLAAKLLAVCLILLGFWAALNWLFPPAYWWPHNWPRLGRDLSYTVAVGALVCVACGLLYLVYLDQRYRCRVCVRRLRMPQPEGNFSSVWLGGTPYTEYICTYGHGKLLVPDVHLASARRAKWTPIKSLWEDLLEAEEMATRR
jgi:hypothetical protein